MKNCNKSGSQSRLAELLNYYDEEKRKSKSNETPGTYPQESYQREPFRQLPQSQSHIYQTDIKAIDSDDIHEFMEDLKSGCELERRDDVSDEGKDYLLVAARCDNSIDNQCGVDSDLLLENFKNPRNEKSDHNIENGGVIVLPSSLEQDVETVLSKDDNFEQFNPSKLYNLNEDSKSRCDQNKTYIYFSSDSQDIEDESKSGSMTLICRDVFYSSKTAKPKLKTERKKVRFTNQELPTSSSEVTNEEAINELRAERLRNGALASDSVSSGVSKSQNIQRKGGIDMNYIVQDIIADVQSATEDVFGAKFNNSHLQLVAKIVAVDMWSESIHVVIKGLQQLAESSLTIKGQKDILDAGGHLAIVVIMKRWSNSPDVVIEACNTLEKASRFTTYFAQSAVTVGALEVILYYMSEYRNDERVQAYGCSALCALAWSKPSAELFVFQLKGIYTFYRAMTSFPYCTLLMQNACWYFNHVSAWAEFRQPVVVAGILGTLSNAIETYTSEENVEKIIQLNAREAVQRLVA